jgi:hypothetical protein
LPRRLTLAARFRRIPAKPWVQVAMAAIASANESRVGARRCAWARVVDGKSEKVRVAPRVCDFILTPGDLTHRMSKGKNGIAPVGAKFIPPSPSFPEFP